MNRTANFVAAMGTIMAVLFLGLCLLPISPVPARAANNADDAGIVIAAKQEARAKRLLTEAVLRSKSPVFAGDVVNTNPVGRLQILFRDNSALMMAPDSQVTINEYVYEGDTPSMRIGFAKGLTRFISGDIVKKRPGAMVVETPRAVARIQGTIVIGWYDGDVLRFALVEISDGKELEVILKSGEKVVLNRAGRELLIYPDGTYRIREIPAADIARINGFLAISGEGGQSGGGLDPEPKNASGNMVVTRFDAADGFMPQTLWSSMYVADVTAPRNFAGTYSGGLSGTDGIYAWSGSFSVGINDLAGAFQVNSVNIDANGSMMPFTIDGSGNLGTVSSGGGFNLNATPGVGNWVGTGAWTAGDTVTINGQTNGKDMSLNLNGTHNGASLTGSGSGSK